MGKKKNMNKNKRKNKSNAIPCSNWDKIKHKKTINCPPYPYYEIGVFTNKKYIMEVL